MKFKENFSKKNTYQYDFSRRLLLQIALLFYLSFSLRAGTTDSITVYIFLSEKCPICQIQSTSMRELYAEFDQKGINFVGVFPNEKVSTVQSIAAFKKEYKIPFELKLDVGKVLTKMLDATVTPQVVVVRDRTKKILYTGKLDNSYERIGKRRQLITEYYLKNTLENITNNKPITIMKTTPVGCFIFVD